MADFRDVKLDYSNPLEPNSNDFSLDYEDLIDSKSALLNLNNQMDVFTRVNVFEGVQEYVGLVIQIATEELYRPPGLFDRIQDPFGQETRFTYFKAHIPTLHASIGSPCDLGYLNRYDTVEKRVQAALKRIQNHPWYLATYQSGLFINRSPSFGDIVKIKFLKNPSSGRAIQGEIVEIVSKGNAQSLDDLCGQSATNLFGGYDPNYGSSESGGTAGSGFVPPNTGEWAKTSKNASVLEGSPPSCGKTQEDLQILKNLYKKNYNKEDKRQPLVCDAPGRGIIFSWPIPSGQNNVSSRTGSRNVTSNPKASKLHGGIDMGCSVGTPVLATADGVVSYSGTASGYGCVLDINHGTDPVDNANYMSRYGHVNKILVQAGQSVFRGQRIALSGGASNDPCRGTSTGPHLHFEISKNGVKINPLDYFELPGVEYTSAPTTSIEPSVPGAQVPTL